MTKMIFGCSHGQDDVERATLPFIAANVAAVGGRRPTSCSPSRARGWPPRATPTEMHFPGMPPLRGLMTEFLDNGGTIWASGRVTKPRDITEDHLISGAAIIGAAKVVEEIAAGAQNITFA